MSWQDIIKNDMEQYEREMLSAEQSGPTEKIPKKEMDDLEDAYEMLDKILSNSTIMGFDTDGGLKDSLQRTRSSLAILMRDYEKSPYLEVEPRTPAFMARAKEALRQEKLRR